MRRIQLIVLAAAVALGTAGFARADHHEKAEKTEKGEQAGGSAADKRSEQAGENSNAQWGEDATRGQERAEERRRAEEQERKEKQRKEKQRQEERHGGSGGSQGKGKH